MRPVVFLEVPDLDQARQWEACLTYANQHGLKVVCLASTPEAAVSVVDAGNAVEVLAVVPRRGGEPACLAGRVRYVREPKRPPGGDLLDQLGEQLLKRSRQLGDVSEADLRTALETVRRALQAPTPPDTHTYPRNVA